MFEQYVDKNIELFPEGKLFRILFDNVSGRFRILAKYPEDQRKLIFAFSVENSGAFFSKQYGYSSESRLYMVNKFGYFSVGLLFEVFSWIKTHHNSLSCVAISENVKRYIKDYLMPLKDFADRNSREDFQVSNISDKYELRDYQTKIIKSIIFDGFGRGLFESPTGSGKSFTIANFIYTLQKQYDDSLTYLIFVPNKQLVEQFYKDLIDYGFDKICILKMTGGEKISKPKKPKVDLKKGKRGRKSKNLKKDQEEQKHKIIIGNRQFIFNNSHLLPKIDVLIADEAHTVSPKSTTYTFVENLDCKIKVGCSGTIPREKYQKLSLLGIFNKVIYTEEVVKLQNQGYLAKLKINLVSIEDQDVARNTNLLFNLKTKQKYVEGGEIAFNEAYTSELKYINDNYEKLYFPVLDKIKHFKGNVLILFDRIEFGKNIFNYASELKLRDSDIFYIDGSVKIDHREYVRQKFEESKNNILFAETAVMSTGINIKNLENIVFMFSGKSLSRTIQSIGRILRLHKDKDFAKVWDIVFNFKYSRKHLSERLALYKEFYNKSKPDTTEKIIV